MRKILIGILASVAVVAPLPAATLLNVSYDPTRELFSPLTSSLETPTE